MNCIEISISIIVASALAGTLDHGGGQQPFVKTLGQSLELALGGGPVFDPGLQLVRIGLVDQRQYKGICCHLNAPASQIISIACTVLGVSMLCSKPVC